MTRILVGVDGSPGSARALAWAAEEARLRNAILVAIHAWSMPVPMVGAAGVGMVPSPEADRTALERAADSVLDEAMAAVPDGIQTHRIAVESPAAAALINEAGPGDLIVVGTRGHGDLAALVLGSVSHDLARHAPCPVVIVPNR